MKQITLLLITFLFVQQANSQNQIFPSIIANAGGESNDQRLSWTFGETMILTIPNDNTQPFITQGFHQPFLQDENFVLDVTALFNDEWGISIFPNPFSQNIFIEKKIEKSIEYELYDLLGKKAQAGILEGNNTQINTAQLTNGVYFLSFFDKKKEWIRTYKITKINY